MRERIRFVCMVDGAINERKQRRLAGMSLAASVAVCVFAACVLIGCSAPQVRAVPADWSLLVQTVGASGQPAETIRVESAGEVRRAIGAGVLVVVGHADEASQRMLREMSDPLFDGDGVNVKPNADAGADEAVSGAASPTQPERNLMARPQLRGMRRANGTLRQRWLDGPQAWALWERMRSLASMQRHEEPNATNGAQVQGGP